MRDAQFKRAKLDLHGSLLSAETLPLPTGCAVATLGHSAVEAIFEPDAGADEAGRRRATLAQAMLEPAVVVGEVDVPKATAADLMFDNDSPSDEARSHCQSAPLLHPLSLQQPSPPIQLTPQPAVSMGCLFDPLSSDDEPPAFATCRTHSSHGSASKALPAELSSQALAATMPGQAISASVLAARPRNLAAGQGLFFSDDEDT